jgi:hypothetical protein
MIDAGPMEIPDRVRVLPPNGGAVGIYCYDESDAVAAEQAIARGAYSRRLRALPWRSRGNGHYTVVFVPQHQAPVACKAGKGQRRKWARKRRENDRNFDAAVAARYAHADLETWLMMLYHARAKRGPRGDRLRYTRRMERWFSCFPKRGERC